MPRTARSTSLKLSRSAVPSPTITSAVLSGRRRAFSARQYRAALNRAGG